SSQDRERSEQARRAEGPQHGTEGVAHPQEERVRTERRADLVVTLLERRRRVPLPHRQDSCMGREILEGEGVEEPERERRRRHRDRETGPCGPRIRKGHGAREYDSRSARLSPKAWPSRRPRGWMAACRPRRFLRTSPASS